MKKLDIEQNSCGFYYVYTKDDRYLLGEIYIHYFWKIWVFRPSDQYTILDLSRLQELAKFIDDL